MDREFVIKTCNKYQKVALFLTGGKVYSGEVKEFGNTSLMFIDRYGEEVPISYDAINHIDRQKERKDRNGKQSE